MSCFHWTVPVVLTLSHTPWNASVIHHTSVIFQCRVYAIKISKPVGKNSKSTLAAYQISTFALGFENRCGLVSWSIPIPSLHLCCLILSDFYDRYINDHVSMYVCIYVQYVCVNCYCMKCLVCNSLLCPVARCLLIWYNLKTLIEVHKQFVNCIPFFI